MTLPTSRIQKSFESDATALKIYCYAKKCHVHPHTPALHPYIQALMLLYRNTHGTYGNRLNCKSSDKFDLTHQSEQRNQFFADRPKHSIPLLSKAFWESRSSR